MWAKTWHFEENIILFRIYKYILSPSLLPQDCWYRELKMQYLYFIENIPRGLAVSICAVIMPIVYPPYLKKVRNKYWKERERDIYTHIFIDILYQRAHLLSWFVYRGRRNVSEQHQLQILCTFSYWSWRKPVPFW
ncbi:hypothetical protein XELAEV_18043442mg [Xenopus laevis]|uniref:Uncharacterized protein n=1 Tax=Xenopus laevis TaxID=8355 RepID=A0A974BX75_XENLA|nr:hypothetical protein XELAEV_18043442mg [Xenopus laevis]